MNKTLDTMKLYKNDDANLSIIKNKKVGIIGYGNQGEAQALNLLDSGINIRKLVNGFDNHISPNISGILGVKCTIDDNEPFDILESFSSDSLNGKIL